MIIYRLDLLPSEPPELSFRAQPGHLKLDSTRPSYHSDPCSTFMVLTRWNLQNLVGLTRFSIQS